MGLGIHYNAHNYGELVTFVDLDYARDLDTRKSLLDIIYKFNNAPTIRNLCFKWQILGEI